MARAPVRTLPEEWGEVEHLVATEGRRLLWLNVLSLVPLIVALALTFLWWQMVVGWRGPLPGTAVPWWQGLALVAAVMPLHELIHAGVIAGLGHRPRVGAKLRQGVLYATTDSGLFRRNEFIAVALAPLVTITLLGMALIAILPDSVGYWVGMALAFNAASAIGDIWMTSAVLRYPAEALVRDEADGIRIYGSTKAM